ncbi:MAG: FAD-dependent oxidoreductase [Betaproteobacteria bacterium]|nr:FAD-dependent oxidoreductase [Betaproteobacteria bacterium]
MAQRRRRDIWDLVVVGGGIAGLTAAWHAARRGLAAALFEAQPGCGGQVATVNVLDDWPAAGPASGVELAAALVAKLHAEAVELFHEPVTHVMHGNGVLLVEAQHRTLRARRIVAASGARLRALGVPGEDALRGRGVSQCAHCDGHFFRGRDVIVVGGGDAALQEALVLSELCRSVSIVARARLRARRGFVERAVGKTNVRFIWDSVVEAVLGSGAVTGVRLRNVGDGTSTEIACSGVFPFVGVEPASAFLPQAMRRDGAGRVMTDERCRTSEPAVFAIGALRSGYAGDLVSAVGEAALAVAGIADDLEN